ncbi:MAG: tetratricopeptide repeat protein [Candidatus Bathyarchaeia archaeon]
MFWPFRRRRLRRADDHLKLAHEYTRKGMLDEAIEEYKRAIEIDPKFAYSYLNLGVAYGSKGMIKEAISELETAVRLNPRYGKAHANLANAYFLDEQYDLAWKHVREAERLGEEVDALIESLKLVSKEPRKNSGG